MNEVVSPFVGDASAFMALFSTDHLARIHDLTRISWRAMGAPAMDDGERAIARQLFREMLRQKKNFDLPFLLHRELCIETDREEGDGFRIDLMVLAGDQESVYYGMEAKKLNVTNTSTGHTDTQAREYITEGMLRFAEGKYSAGLPHAAMLGFVMNGDIVRATSNIDRLLPQFAERLCLAEFELAQVAEPDLFRTDHDFALGSMRLFHLFLPRSAAA